jgi:hypothetical protein
MISPPPLSLSIFPQIFSVAILLYTPLVCHQPIAVPIMAAYGGVLTRCTISLIGFYYLVFPKLSKTTVVSVLYNYVPARVYMYFSGGHVVL